MADMPNTPTGSRKRSHDGELISSSPAVPNVVLDGYKEKSTNESAREPSPALSVASSGSALTELTPSIGQSQAPSTTGDTSQKKRKLTFAEREVERAVKRREKEERENQRAEDKARKDEEKRKRDEEKRKVEEEKEEIRRVKEIEKAEKQKVKDAEKQVKDAEKAKKEAEKVLKEAEKAQKEAEKLKKERSQLRLGNFFQKPVPASTPPSIPDDASSGVSSRRSSITSIDADMPDADLKPARTINPEFKRWFPPFFIHDHTVVAPANRFLQHHSAIDLSHVDRLLSEHKEATEKDMLPNLAQTFKSKNAIPRKGTRFIPVKKLLEQIDGTATCPINLTREQITNTPKEALKTIPIKVLSYSVDVRPPYQGTFTRVVSPKSSRKISRQPAQKILPDVNYDYDSEAEWQEPEEGDEDLNSEDDEAEDEEDEENMDDFLDDENDMTRRRMITGDVEPDCSGLCWQGDTATASIEVSLKQYRMDLLDDAHLFPIDPFSTSYWAKPMKNSPVKVESLPLPTAIGALMQPPRLPLSTMSSTNTLVNQGFVSASTLSMGSQTGENAPLPKQRGRPVDLKKPMKIISPELLSAFKQEVEGSDLTKAGLIEILKKKFAKVPKDVIKDTLSVMFVRQGVKEADKKWALKAGVY